MERLAVSLCRRYNDWQKSGLVAIAGDWKAAAAHLGKPVITRQADGTAHCGIFEDLAPDGSMVLHLKDGRRKTMTAGDVVQARPEGHDHAAGD